MNISIIAAMSEDRLIGSNNELPWGMPADLQHFKSLTMGKAMIMGRKTFDSIGKPLPGRQSIIVTRDKNYQVDGAQIAHDIDAALEAAENRHEIMIIGGANIYEQTLDLANCLYLTIVHSHFEGDRYFPEINFDSWEEIQRVRHEADEKNPFPYTFLTLHRAPSS